MEFIRCTYDLEKSEKARFKSTCAGDNRKMAEVIRYMVRDYNLGVLNYDDSGNLRVKKSRIRN